VVMLYTPLIMSPRRNNLQPILLYLSDNDFSARTVQINDAINTSHWTVNTYRMRMSQRARLTYKTVGCFTRVLQSTRAWLSSSSWTMLARPHLPATCNGLIEFYKQHRSAPSCITELFFLIFTLIDFLF